ncbi:MAG: hypothetical protein NTV80_13880 [Verrucomicrobia bacterium]|nr:hypothetical protein [Verrucomicrobiota bacterium]
MIPEPFGGLFILVGIAGCFLLGLAIAIAGRRSKIFRITGVGIIVAPWALLMLASVLIPGVDEWNPTIESDSEAVGAWEGDGYKIELKRDATFVMQHGRKSSSGFWRRMDWNVYLASEHEPERYMRFVEDSDELLLLPDPPRDDSFQPGPIMRKRD